VASVLASLNTVDQALFFNIDFPWLFHDQKMKIHDLSAVFSTHIFSSKWYTTYECIPELVVTVPSARSTTVKKIKRFIIWLYKWSRVTFSELFSAVVKIPRHYHHFPWPLTFAIFHDFPGLENGLPKFHDFPWPGGTLVDPEGKERSITQTSSTIKTSSLTLWPFFRPVHTHSLISCCFHTLLISVS